MVANHCIRIDATNHKKTLCLGNVLCKMGAFLRSPNLFALEKPPSIVHVAVGVIRNELGEILVAHRHHHRHQGGLWEFPGGKVEAGETVEQALQRELREELAINVEQACPLIQIGHDYGDKKVFLDVWRVDRFSGQPHGLEGQPIRWVAADALPQLEFPAANRPIVAAARLPDYYPIIDGLPDQADALFAKLERLCQQGYTLAQWRMKTAEDATWLALARSAVAYSQAHGLQLLLNATPERALQVGAAGVHLTGQRLLALRGRPWTKDLWVAASCHSPEDIRHAEQIGVDFIVLSPVLPTPSHPDTPPLGWDCFGAWTQAACVPVFALGGMAQEHLAQAQTLGAQGIAGIRGFGDA
jgi:8-oxo-dGTP diphosphatase